MLGSTGYTHPQYARGLNHLLTDVPVHVDLAGSGCARRFCLNS